MFVRINQALAASRAKREDNEKGFTLIELLVVVLIIGILSAIAIPIFLGQQNSAKDAAAKSDLANSKAAVIAYAAANNGTYPASATAAGLSDNGYISTVAMATTGAGSASFCLSETGATAWKITATSTGAVAGSCP